MARAKNRPQPPIHTLLDRRGKDSHKADRHRQTVPEESLITWFKVIVSRAETSQKNAEEEQHGCLRTTELPQPYGTYAEERNVRDHVTEMGYAEERALIGEVVIILILNNWRQQEESEQRCKHKNGKAEFAPLIYSGAEHHLDNVATAGYFRKRALLPFSSLLLTQGGNRWQRSPN